MDAHNAKILDQFTKQAVAFQATHRSAEHAIEHALTASGITSDDIVLDVACGPGVLACAFAKRAKHVTGADITPTMLAEAKQLQAASRLDNLSWQQCDVTRLPFPDESFTMVITRYAVHHFEQPRAVVKELARVCRRGGKVVIIDSAPPQEKEAAFNRIELLRDPSHTKALPLEELSAIVRAEGLEIERQQMYAWETAVESLLQRSFPADGDRDRIAQLYAADVGIDDYAMNARYLDGALHVTFPTLITVARKP